MGVPSQPGGLGAISGPCGQCRGAPRLRWGVPSQRGGLGAISGPPCNQSSPQTLELQAVGTLGLGAEPALAVGLVVLIVALEPHHTPLVLEGEHVGGDAVEEPAVVADDDDAAREIE